MRKIMTIAKATVRDALRQRVLNVLLVFGLLSIATIFFLSRWSVGEQDKMILDIGIGAIWFFGILISLIMGAFTIPWEIERRTIFTVLSKPVRRLDFMLGKFLGTMATLFINLLLMTIVFLVAYSLKAMQLHTLNGITLWNIAAAVILCFLALMILTMLAIVTSTRSSASFSIIFAAFLFIIGNTSDMLRSLGEHGSNALVRGAGTFLHYVLPNFQQFDVRQAFTNQSFVPYSLVGASFVYALVYTVILVLVGYLLFNEREL